MVSVALRRNLVLGVTVFVECDMFDSTHAHLVVDSIMQRTQLQHMIIDTCTSIVEGHCNTNLVVKHFEMSAFTISPTAKSSKRSFA